ncbi:NAD(+) diphosphatase [Terricaulis silvestris]|uniref:NAD(+) diphosphatase n=1 Tax=Terricaulis silvestris TaxID=2686094 RepID=A0A6I6MRV7_9CAUL|nr:NAD(+) diphosphatase [Terricaulis silvestris]QGZ94382.1 NADH pyrophosphatase [Terricaulis silvestris]
MALLPHNPNAFARSPLDRAGHHRRDEAWLATALAAETTRIVPFFRHRPFVVDDGDAVAVGWLGAHARSAIAPADARTLFLGLDAEGAAHFAVDVPDDAPLNDIGRFDDLRALGPRLSREELATIGPAKAVFEWHAKSGFCANCGVATVVSEAGWKRECPTCNAEHFPRVDPVCIMLPVIGEKCFLARQRMWPRGMHSALAGFIEPGETIEEAVARETLEEAGLRVCEVRLHSTQPWPFPHSLMIGAICEVDDDRETVDTHELESGRWFTRDEARALMAGKHPDAFCPPPFAIAHQLLKTWSEG